MKSKINEYISGLIAYDYILFMAVFILFILLIILGIVFRKKLLLALLLIFTSFLILVLGPTLGRSIMYETLFQNSTELLTNKRLSFVEAVVVTGLIKNESTRNFKICKITASAYKISSNKFRNYFYELKPFKQMSIVEDDILVSEAKEFKMILEPFTYKKDYNISLGARCK